MTSKSNMKDFFSSWEIHAFMVKPFEPDALYKKIEELRALAERMTDE